MMIQVLLSLLWSTEDLEPTFFCGAIFTKIIQVVLSLLWLAKRLGNYFCCCTIFIMMIQVVLSLLWSAKRISQTIWLYVPISKNCVTFWERKMKRMAEILLTKDWVTHWQFCLVFGNEKCFLEQMSSFASALQNFQRNHKRTWYCCHDIKVNKISFKAKQYNPKNGAALIIALKMPKVQITWIKMFLFFFSWKR